MRGVEQGSSRSDVRLRPDCVTIIHGISLVTDDRLGNRPRYLELDLHPSCDGPAEVVDREPFAPSNVARGSARLLPELPEVPYRFSVRSREDPGDLRPQLALALVDIISAAREGVCGDSASLRRGLRARLPPSSDRPRSGTLR